MFGEPVDAVQFLRDTDILRAMRHALVTADTVAGLAEFGDAAVVAHYSLNIFSEILFYRISLYISYLQIFSFGLNTHEISRF